ncbi:cupin [Agrobacterium tumefaciens]|uniref:Cupin n=1 Tax=Agrobacterium tumefaciens TaxID=358 RepID=A0AA44J7N6_AGRTU|nr:cupin [Agrobacterium tumefaciens]NSL24040.1 cupin [Agrobacterium tumefaciens]NTB88003.1 cupin [Agrobacterium tumefaciens]NTC15528.1 cupin [Agrobacterium tumefaciens]NTC27819.1 cupin [Agrobacterium tumefaciens]NTC55649.1 cupin [Agrobacterium tumefaciens]
MNVEKITLNPGDQIPNNQTFPVIIYRQVGSPFDSAAFEALFARNGWRGIWRNGVFAYHHYHSGAHEVLGVGGGEATLQIGGPDGQTLHVTQGDCLVLPAGTGHMKLKSSADFQVVGAYPPGQEVDVQTSAPTSAMLAQIKSLPKPTTDPVHGASGDLIDLW